MAEGSIYTLKIKKEHDALSECVWTVASVHFLNNKKGSHGMPLTPKIPGIWILLESNSAVFFVYFLPFLNNFLAALIAFKAVFEDLFQVSTVWRVVIRKPLRVCDQ